MVIFLFLRSLSATIIPSIAVPLSPGGHLRRDVPGGLQPEQPDDDGADHFDPGFVVDDAIVMVENISRFIEEGEDADGRRR